MPRVITSEEKKYFLSIKQEDISLDLITELFADTSSKQKNKDGKTVMVKKPSKFKQNDIMVLEPNEYINKEKVRTNLGLFIFNKFIVEGPLEKVLGYINEPITNSEYDKIDSKMSNALLNDVISVDTMIEYLNKMHWGYALNSIFCSSYTMKTFKPDPEIIRMRDKLLAENKEGVERGDPLVLSKIEKQLLDFAKEKLKGDPGMDLFDSKAKGSFGNNYKNMSLMKGVVYNSSTEKYDVVKNNLIEGISKETIPTWANTVISGGYPKSVATAISGAMTKQIIAAYQAIVLDMSGKDCGTKGYLNILLTPWMRNDVLYSYIIEGEKLVLLDDSNIDKYIGKKIKLRNPMFCIGEKKCRKCAGEMYYKLGIENIGLTASKISGTMVNAGMKAFHDNTVKGKSIDLNKLTL